jgi:hypothetical protein
VGLRAGLGLGALALVLLLSATATEAQTRGWFPRVSGQCGWVHGRFAIYNGSGVRRIWVIGTSHMLNLYDSDEDVPHDLDAFNGSWTTFGGTLSDALYGDFYVCALERYRSGHMQHVGIRRVRNLVRAPFRL